MGQETVSDTGKTKGTFYFIKERDEGHRLPLVFDSIETIGPVEFDEMT